MTIKVAMMGTYGEKCGVAEYGKELINGLLSKNVKVTLIKNQPKDNLYEITNEFHPLFDTPFLTQKNQANIHAMIDILKSYDILHVQFETNLYHPDWFFPFIKKLKETNKNIKLVFTMHSANMWQGFPAELVDCYLSHEPMWCSNYIIPMPVKFYDYIIQEPESYKSVTSFGLGRNNDDIIRNSLQNNPDVTFRTTYGHHKWFDREELVKEIKKSWVISLYYPQIDTQVTSSALRLAMGCNRPILVSNTNWFKSSFKYENLYVCDNLNEVTDTIKYLTDSSNLHAIQNVINNTKSQVIKEQETFDDFITDHIAIYKKVVMNEVDRKP